MASSAAIFGLVAGMASCPPNSGLPFHTGQVRGSRAHCRFSCSEAGIWVEVADAAGGQGFKGAMPCLLLLLSGGCREWASSEAEHPDGKRQARSHTSLLRILGWLGAACLPAYLGHRPGSDRSEMWTWVWAGCKSTSYREYGSRA